MSDYELKPQQKRDLQNHFMALVGITKRTRPGQVTHKLEEIKAYVETIVKDAYQQGKADMRDEMEEQLPL
jgi:hypothetical protein